MFRVLIFSILAFLFVTNCGKKDEVKFEAFSPEAFAYDLGSVWEVNATVNIKGFRQEDSDERFTTSINYTVDLIQPSGEKNESVYENLHEGKSDEMFSDLQIEAQFELDSSYAPGKYELMFNIKDNIGGEKTQVKVEFNLAE